MSRMVLTAALVGLIVAAPVAAQALPFEPGEEVKMSVSFLSVNIGDFRLDVRDDMDSGVRVWPIRMHGTSSGLVGAFYKIDSTFTTNYNPASKTSTSSFLSENHGDFHKTENTRFVGDTAVIHRVQNGGVHDETTSVLPGSVDVLAAIYALRSLPMTNSAEVQFPIFTGHKNWVLTAHVVGHESVNTDAGKFDAVVVQCRTQFGGKFTAKGDLTMWFSNDERRIPLKIQAPFSIGTIEASLISYHAGPIARN